MDCPHARSRLAAFVSGELPAEARRELRLHLAGCRDCHRAWLALDPVGATRAFGTVPHAPQELHAAVMAAVRQMSIPARRPAGLGTPSLGLAAAGVLLLWLGLRLAEPFAVVLLAAWLQAVVSGATVAAETLRLGLQAAAPVLPALAGLLVLGELVLLGRWTRPA